MKNRNQQEKLKDDTKNNSSKFGETGSDVPQM